MESKTRSLPHASPETERLDAMVGELRRPRDGTWRRLGLAIVAATALATAGGILVGLYEHGWL